MDNLFVFVLLFKTFQVELLQTHPVHAAQHASSGAGCVRAQGARVRHLGCSCASCRFYLCVARETLTSALTPACTVLGAAALERFRPILLVFAVILLAGSFKILAGKDDDEEEDIADNAIVRLVQSVLPVTSDFRGDAFFVVESGVRSATPLLLVLVVVELSDLVFAVDSIPAVFGVTNDPFIVYTSNLFAISSLRALFSVVASSMSKMVYLEKAVALVLGFVGLKMVADISLGVEVPTAVSLAVVASALAGGIGLSLAFPPPAAENTDKE